MATEQEVQESTDTAESADKKIQFALLLELEYIASNAREVEFDLLKSLLGEKGKNLQVADFARFCIASKPEFYLDNLLSHAGIKRVSTEKLAEDLRSGLALHYSSGNLTSRDGFEAIVKTAQAKQMKVAAVTGLPEDIYKPLCDKLGLEKLGVAVFAFDNPDREFPRADVYLKVVKEMEVQPRHCVAFVTTSPSCKAALTAGMRSVAIPDVFTAFQDFGGAYSVADSLEEFDAADFFTTIPDLEITDPVE